MGIHAQILYPNSAGFGSRVFGKVKDPELRRLCATIFNDDARDPRCFSRPHRRMMAANSLSDPR